MNTKLFAIKIPENEKNAMDYISEITNNKLSRLFYKPIQDSIYTNLGYILLYKIDLRNTKKIPELHRELFSREAISHQTLPIVEDFVRLMLDKDSKKGFWSIFSDLQLNEKDFILYDLDLSEIANYMGKEYLSSYGTFEEIDLNLAREIFFNYMLKTYFNITALGSIKILNQEWTSHVQLINQFQNQLIIKYLNRYQPKKLEAIKVDEIVEVSEYLE
jgi:hypothetical protein